MVSMKNRALARRRGSFGKSDVLGFPLDSDRSLINSTRTSDSASFVDSVDG